MMTESDIAIRLEQMKVQAETLTVHRDTLITQLEITKTNLTKTLGVIQALDMVLESIADKGVQP